MRSLTVGVNTAGQEVVDRLLAAPHDRGPETVGDKGLRMLGGQLGEHKIGPPSPSPRRCPGTASPGTVG